MERAFVIDHDRNILVRIFGPLAIFLLLGIFFLAMEWTTRAYLQRGHRDPLYYRRNIKRTRDLSQLGFLGVSPNVTFTTNEVGLRGEPMPAKNDAAYKIIAVGGSTTECLTLDDSQEWAHLLMQKLNREQKGRRVWVGNAGVSAKTSVDHLLFLRRIPVLSQADMLVFLMGVNDLQAALDFGGASTQKVLEERAELFAGHAPAAVSPTASLFRRSWFLMKVLEVWNNINVRDPNGMEKKTPLQEAVATRDMAPLVALPSLDVALSEYTSRVRALEKECFERKLRCVYLTQPSIWRSDLSPAQVKTIWLGRVGRKGHTIGFVSITDLANAMDAYNQTLLALCRNDHLECYDLASAIPKDTSAFYDDVHFNISGGRKVAEFVAEQLKATAPFSDSRR
jgi:lysophospholipase L1-like esterase